MLIPTNERDSMKCSAILEAKFHEILESPKNFITHRLYYTHNKRKISNFSHKIDGILAPLKMGQDHFITKPI